MTNSRSPHPVDVHVGEILRQRRKLAGFTQERLADAIGLTFQQIQKYEMGRNRVSASRLYQFSKVLETPISVFFEGYNSNDSDAKAASGFAEEGQASFDAGENNAENTDVMKSRETINLVRAYYAITDETLRRSFLKMLKQMAKNIQAS